MTVILSKHQKSMHCESWGTHQGAKLTSETTVFTGWVDRSFPGPGVGLRVREVGLSEEPDIYTKQSLSRDMSFLQM